MLEATHSQAQGLVFVLKIFSLYTFSSILLGFLVECMSILSSFLAMLSAFGSSSVPYVLLFQPLRCEDPPRCHSLHCPCSTRGKSQSWIHPFPFLLYSHSEWTSNAGEKPQSSANWSSTDTKSLGLAEPSTLCTTSPEFLHLAFSTSPALHLSLPSQYTNLLSLPGMLTSHFVSAPLFFQVCSLSAMASGIHFSLSYIFNISHGLLSLFLPFNNKTYLNPSQNNPTALSSFLSSHPAKFLIEWSTHAVSTLPEIVNEQSMSILTHVQ